MERGTGTGERGGKPPDDDSRHPGSNELPELTPDELKGLPLVAQARGISLAQAKSEMLTAKLRDREGKANAAPEA